MTRNSYVKTNFELWNTPGITTAEADVIGISLPFPLVRTLGVGQTQMMARMDRELVEGLERAGLALKKGDEGVGSIDYAVLKRGHFHIDQGACQIIVDGRIKIHRREQGVADLALHGVVQTDANRTTVPADIIALATGFHRNTLTVEKMMGTEVKKRVGDLGYFDEEQERIGVNVYFTLSRP